MSIKTCGKFQLWFNSVMSMKVRSDADWVMDAQELSRQFGAPGDVAFAVKCLKFGYSLGILDSTEELRKLGERIRTEKAISNAPR